MLQRYVRSLYDNLFEHIRFELYSIDTHLDKFLREKLSSWMCSTGDERCREEAIKQFGFWFKGIGLHPDMQIAIFCGAVAAGGATEFDFIMNKYNSTPRYEDTMRRRFIKGLGCTLNQDLMKKYLS